MDLKQPTDLETLKTLLPEQGSNYKRGTQKFIDWLIKLCKQCRPKLISLSGWW